MIRGKVFFVFEFILVISLLGCIESNKVTKNKIHRSFQLMKVIEVPNTLFSIKMKIDSTVFFIERNAAIRKLKGVEDTLSQSINSGINKERNEYIRSKFSAMREIIENGSEYEIVNPSTLDSLEEYDYNERQKIIDKNPHLYFKFYFKDLICPLIDSGYVAIDHKNKFIDYAYKYQYTSYTKFDSYSSIIYANIDTSILFQCGPYETYQFKNVK